MSPEEIARREFASSMRGYDKAEVRAFLSGVARNVEELQATLSNELEAAPTTPALPPAPGVGATPAEMLSSIDKKPVLPAPPGEPALFGRGSAADDPELSVDDAHVGDVTSADVASADVVDVDSISLDHRETDVVPVAQSLAGPDELIETEAIDPSEDRFQALGERIAGLLRTAHESATSVRENADSEAKATIEMARAAAEAMEIDARTRSEAEREDAADAAAAMRAAAEEEAADVRARAQSESEAVLADAQRVIAEAEERRVEMAAESAELRQQSLEAGETELAEQRAQVEAELADAQADRAQAMTELAEARDQVMELLGQARSQSDFIQHEADEIIRGRVRENVDKAEDRLAILRNSEVASRNRIAAAHSELASAMERLDADPVPEFPSDTDQRVLAAAKDKGQKTEYGSNEDAAAELDDPWSDEPLTEVAEWTAPEALEAEVAEEEAEAVEWTAPETLEPEVAEEAEAVEWTAPEELESEVVGEVAEWTHPVAVEDIDDSVVDDSVVDDSVDEIAEWTAPTELEPDYSDTTDYSDITSTGQTEIAAEPALPVRQPGAEVDQLQASQDEPELVESELAEPELAETERVPVTVGASAEHSEGGAPENEDALARLVREAMQRAVDTARRSGD